MLLLTPHGPPTCNPHILQRSIRGDLEAGLTAQAQLTQQIALKTTMTTTMGCQSALRSGQHSHMEWEAGGGCPNRRRGREGRARSVDLTEGAAAAAAAARSCSWPSLLHHIVPPVWFSTVTNTALPSHCFHECCSATGNMTGSQRSDEVFTQNGEAPAWEHDPAYGKEPFANGPYASAADNPYGPVRSRS
eukprot:1146208-Pelagomonas_calceolata.AAC.5